MVSKMYFLASGTIVSAGTSSPSEPGTQPVSSNISLALSKRALSSLVNALPMVGFSCAVQRCSVSRNETLWNIGSELLSLRLDVGRDNHLAPFFGLVGDELAEIGGRACEHRAA